MDKFLKWLDEEIKQAKEDIKYSYGDIAYELAVDARITALEQCKREYLLCIKNQGQGEKDEK